MITMTSAPTRVVLALASLAAVAASCGNDAGADKLGGHGDVEPVTLTVAHGGGGGGAPEALTAFADEVGRRSGGTMTFEYHHGWRRGDVDTEARTVEDVQAGTFDMALVGARVFDELGVDSFQALLAAMLVDSHNLQEAVFEAGIPTEMLAGVDELDNVVGIAVLPGPMRKILGIDHPFASPADFDGEVIGVTQSAVADETMAALGATSLDMGGGEPLLGIDALEQQFDSIVSNSYTEVADYVTANINLWPRPLVIVMNAERFESLSAEQQSTLLDAGPAMIPGQLDAARREDNHGATIICRTETAMTVATDEDLAAMHTALEPVYADLASDPVTAEYLEAITALKEEIAAPPDSAECEAAEPDRSGFPQGTFENDTNRLELADGLYALTDHNGVLMSPRAGYEVFEDHVTFEAEFSGRWTFDGTTLTFSQLTAPDGSPIAPDSAWVWGHEPWALVTDDDAADTTSP
jgi:TRAP-type C4-dicarboxylate transport system substrate-binding protein